VYDKSRALYGLRQGKRAIRQENEAILVEGYTAVISLSQAGVKHAVASSGTALTEQQVKTLGRYAKRLILLYDADEAGARAARRGMDLVLAEELGAYVVELPDGEDPDSFVQAHGAEAFEQYLAEKRQDLPAFRYRQAERAGELDTPEDRVEVQRGIIRSIAKIPDASLRREYVRRTSEVLGVPDNDLFRMLDEALSEEARRAERRARRQEKPHTAPRAPVPDAPVPDVAPLEAREHPNEETHAAPLPEERVLIRLLLDHGEPMVEFILGNMALDEFSAGPPRTLVRALADMYAEGALNTERALNGALGPDVQNLAASVMMDEYEPSQHWGQREITVPRLNEKPYEAAASAMTLLKLDRVNEAIDVHRQKIYQADQNGDEEALRMLQNQMMGLHDLRKRIERREYLEWTA
jgi:DNA primase